VAAGTGNVAIRAAKAGATVVASDLTPENFTAGRRAAAAERVELEWREADAEALPFDDGEFDVVTSCFGAISRRTGGESFQVLAPYVPPLPAGALPPVLWGNEEHVRKLLGNGIALLEMTRGEYVETAASPREYYDLFQQTFGPMVAIRASLAGQPQRVAALDRDFFEFIARSNRGTPDAPVRMPYEYLLVVARKRGA
jgi:SAM-dependent methyltransferase